jgi:hypothetical protein
MSFQPSRLAVLITLVVITATHAEANVGARSLGGSPAGEPDGIGTITIAREDLVIDLRPLAAGGMVAVAATYHLDNPSEEKHLDLVFAAGSGTTDFQVALDGRPVPSARSSGVQLPAAWRPPRSTPLFDGSELGYELRHEPIPVGFRLDVPRGRHDLAISYRADAVLYHLGEPTLVRQFAYVLSPARTWGGFGGLDVTVHVPPGWRAAITPALPRDGDTLHATFATVPADAIALTVQAPPGAHGLVRIATGVLFVLVAIGGGFVVAWRTRATERRHQRISPSGLAAFGRGVLWGAAVLAAGVLALQAPDLVLPDGQVDHHGYGQAVAYLGVILASAVVTAIGTGISLAVGNRVHAPPRTDP